MNKWTKPALLVATVVSLFVMQSAIAQNRAVSQTNGATDGQMLKEILKEVQQLRAIVERQRVTTYQPVVMVERLRNQNAQVTRLSEALATISPKLSDTRISLTGMKEKAEDAEKKLKVGIMSDTEAREIRARLEETQQRELILAQEESQLIRDLAVERASLNDLNRQIDELECEIKKSVTK